jgi:hypothetical protein
MRRLLRLLHTDRVAKLGLAVVAIALPLLLAVPSTSWGRSHPTPSPSPTPVADPAITKIARQQFVAWQSGVIDKSLYAPQLQAQLTDAKISDTSHALGQLGALTDTVFIGNWLNPNFPAGTHGYIYQMRCEVGNVYLWMALGADGKVVTLFFRNRLDVESVTPSPSATPTHDPRRAL